ncbi:uncharacterized protein [Apostichopus japonicus]|uniref:uncharacterized protein n=1 Tax=Stichopus japonicus TaxID=307972 RepID=UPI003AB5D44F
MAAKYHDPLYIFMIIFVLFMFLFTLFINGLAGAGEVEAIPWFTGTTGGTSDNYDTNINPAGFTFIIWGVIYVWQLVWIVYAHVIICVKSDHGAPIYADPPIISPVLLSVYSLNLCVNITWLFLFDREELVWALVVISTIAITLFICIGHLCWMTSLYRYQLTGPRGRKYLFFTRLFLLNGLGVYATWTTVATMINLSIVLVYFQGQDQDTSCTISLCILAAIAVGYFLLEVTSLEKHLRWFFAPWPVLIWALCGVIVNNWDKEDRNSIISVCLVCLAAVFLVIKVVVTTVRARQRERDEYDTKEGIDNMAMTQPKA